MATHRTDFQINASNEQVWAVLVDFENYADWNPSLPSISGDLREGSTVSLTLALPGRPNLNVKAQLREATPNRRLTWRGWPPGRRSAFYRLPRVLHPAPR